MTKPHKEVFFRGTWCIHISKRAAKRTYTQHIFPLVNAKSGSVMAKSKVQILFSYYRKAPKLMGLRALRWSLLSGSNWRPDDYKSTALPAELRRRLKNKVLLDRGLEPRTNWLRVNCSTNWANPAELRKIWVLHAKRLGIAYRVIHSCSVKPEIHLYV